MMLLPLLLGLASAPQAGPAEQVIDDFRYYDVAAARRAWNAAEGTPPVELVPPSGDTSAAGRTQAMRIDARFASQPTLGRAVVDRRAALDLSVPGEFAMEIASDSPEAFGNVTLYFRSGKGWYGSSAGLTKKGWQTLHFSKASFRTEETPSGWGQIEGIRIAAWRGQVKDASLQVRRLAALSHEVALVVPSPAGADGEYHSAMESASLVSGMLEELGLGSDAIEDSALARGALGSRRVAILAYHPRLPAEADAALVRFVEKGGKVLVCYTLPPQLGAALGFGKGRYVRPEHPGGFAEIRFGVSPLPLGEGQGVMVPGATVAGLPKAVRQASWNITAAEPTTSDARVIARWCDDAGKPTGHAALLLSARGAFLSHIVLGDDREGKKQMLAALLGHLAPPLWQHMAEAEIDRAGTIGDGDGLKMLRARFQQGMADASKPAVAERLQHGRALLDDAKTNLARADYPKAVELARTAHEEFVGAYLRAQGSNAREGRAMWNHSGTGAYPGDWQRTAKLLAANGFNMVVPNMLWGGLAHYPSDVLPRSDVFRQHGDQVEQCVAAAHAEGIEVHVWKVNYNLSTAPKSFVEQMRRAGRTQVDFRGRAIDWICPSHPENRRLELESMTEVARKYRIDGLHFDYIRYPGRETCYCDGCRQRFEKDSGRPVAQWPADCHSGTRKDEYNDWRCRQITALVAAVAAEARKIRPELKISAAVFGSYPSCRESVAQDWPAWVKAGYLDFLCPMDYTLSDTQFGSLVESQLALVDRRIPVYPGIGATASSSTLSADRVVSQIVRARTAGAAGFCIFNLDRGTAESIVPGVGLGIGRQRAVPPHSK